jgi:hypothetical protein
VTRRSRELIVEWNASYGEPPCPADWNPSPARWRTQDWRAERYREGVWPSTNAAKRPFGGSFDAAVRASSPSGPRSSRSPCAACTAPARPETAAGLTEALGDVAVRWRDALRT